MQRSFSILDRSRSPYVAQPCPNHFEEDSKQNECLQTSVRSKSRTHSSRGQNTTPNFLSLQLRIIFPAFTWQLVKWFPKNCWVKFDGPASLYVLSKFTELFAAGYESRVSEGSVSENSARYCSTRLHVDFLVIKRSFWGEKRECNFQLSLSHWRILICKFIR